MNILSLLSQLLIVIAISDVCIVTATPASAPPEQLSTQHIASTASSVPNRDAVTKNLVTASADRKNNQALKNAAEVAREKQMAKGVVQRLGTLRGQGAQGVADTAADARKAVAVAWRPSTMPDEGAQLTKTTKSHIEPAPKTPEEVDYAATFSNLQAEQNSGVAEVERISEESENTIPTRAEAKEQPTVSCAGGVLSCWGCVLSCGGEEEDEFKDYTIEQLKKLISEKETEKQKGVEQLALAEEWKKTEEDVRAAEEKVKKAMKKIQKALGGGAGSAWCISGADTVYDVRQAYMDQVKKLGKLDKEVKKFRATAKKKDDADRMVKTKKNSNEAEGPEVNKEKTWLDRANEAVNCAAARVKAAEETLKKMHKSLEKKGERKEKGAEALKLGEATKEAKAQVDAEIAQQKAETEALLKKVEEEFAEKGAEALRKYNAAMKKLASTASAGSAGVKSKADQDKEHAARKAYKEEVQKLENARKAAEEAVKAGEKSWEKVQERARQIMEGKAEGTAKQAEIPKKIQPTPAVTSTSPPPKATAVANTAQFGQSSATSAQPATASPPPKPTPVVTNSQTVPFAPAPAKPVAASQPVKPETYESLAAQAEEAWKEEAALAEKLKTVTNSRERANMHREYQNVRVKAESLTNKAKKAKKAEKAKKAN